jgi:LEA14-like dessication related protein
MRTQPRTRIALAALAAALAAGCAGLQDLARSAFREPKLSFRSASVQALDLEGATIGLLFDLQNPNSVGVELARAAWAVEVDGTRIGAGDMPGGLSIPANGTAPITLPVRVRFADVPGIVSLLGSGKDALPYKVSGSVGVKTPLGVLDLPLSHSDQVKLPRVPRFGVDGLSVRSVSFDSISLGVLLRVTNPNGFPMPPGALDTAVAVGGKNVARTDGAKLQAVPGGASTTIEIPVRVDLAAAGRVASDLVQGGDVDVHLQGKADVAGLPLPVDVRARVPARR